ncbi:MAG: hypothetical protein OXC02_06055 [Rhodobacteraceae bacterium]|nr:hypothetical protein [Paracoccaceae bacterium]
MIFASAYAQTANGAIQTASVSGTQLLCHPLFWIEVVLLLLILIAAPIYSNCLTKKMNLNSFKGLNLPEGSVRAMLALLIVGSFVNVLLFGADVLGDNFEQVITAFGTLAGAVTGFYFAGRKSDSKEGSLEKSD